MARKYSVKAGGRRWPVNTFHNILDLAGIRITRLDFLLKHADELSKDYTETGVGAIPVHVEPSDVGGNCCR